MYSILGVSGQVGRITADNLLHQNLPVKAILRNSEKTCEWEQKGATVALANLNDAASLTAAFTGAEGIFVLCPPLFNSDDPIAYNQMLINELLIAIEKAKPKKIVYLSSVGGHLSAGTGAILKLHHLEQAFKRLDIPTVAIRAAWFMENYAGSIAPTQKSGELRSFLNPKDKQIAMVSVKDIGKLAAELLEETWEGHRTIELEGPCRYAAADVAMVLSHQLKREVSVLPIPATQYEATYKSFGFTPTASALMAEMNNGFNNGIIDFEGNPNEHRTGEILLEDALSSLISAKN